MKKVKGFVTPYKTPPAGGDSNIDNEVYNKNSSTKKVTTTPKPTTALSSKTVSNKSSSVIKSAISKSNELNSNSDNSSNNADDTYFKVMWCNMSSKKHKTYMDGVIVVNSVKKMCILMDCETKKDIGRSSTLKFTDFKPGFKSSMSSKDIEIVEQIDNKEYQDLIGDVSAGSSSSSSSSSTTTTSKKAKESIQQEPDISTDDSASTLGSGFKIKEFKSHTNANASVVNSSKQLLQPRHDPNAKDSLILYSPPTSGVDESGKRVIHVVMDPYIGQHLRPHQRRGVQFLYDCVTGSRHQFGNGCILADQMGLGKTLMTLATIWTLLKQSPSGKPTFKKAIIVTPAGLVGNWKKEIKRWFGAERLKPFTLNDSVSKKTKEMLEEFNTSTVHPILIISYDQCRIFSSILETMSCGLLVCDEGHRLKNMESKTTQSISSINAKAKIVLSGTPIQNDLIEFHSLVDFCNPGSLGTLSQFKKEYANPIIKGREESTKEGIQRAIQLSKITSSFILRRKSNVLEEYLPPKTIHIVFCRLSEFQKKLYRIILERNSVESIIEGRHTSLATITTLKQLCNYPSLISNDYADLFPVGYDPSNQFISSDSGKMEFVEQLILKLRDIGDRIVLVSNYTQTLDVFELLLKKHSLQSYRIDGQVKPTERQDRVDRFNDPTNKTHNVFLLSAKAGGVGLNLIGANHIVLFDPDWNPAIDIQAMERVWREGQTKPVSIYRLMATGTIEEKIYQRQLIKESLSNRVVDKSHNDKATFTDEELRDIFSLNEQTQCETHDLLMCKCCNSSNKSSLSSVSSEKKDILQNIPHMDIWDHYLNSKSLNTGIWNSINFNTVSFVFKSKPKTVGIKEVDDNISFLDVDGKESGDVKDDDEGEVNENDEEEEKDRKKVIHTTKKSKITTTKKNNKENSDEEEDEEEYVVNKGKKRIVSKSKTINIDDDDLDELEM